MAAYLKTAFFWEYVLRHIKKVSAHIIAKKKFEDKKNQKMVYTHKIDFNWVKRSVLAHIILNFIKICEKSIIL